jgi:hypothetical protein
VRFFGDRNHYLHNIFLGKTNSNPGKKKWKTIHAQYDFYLSTTISHYFGGTFHVHLYFANKDNEAACSPETSVNTLLRGVTSQNTVSFIVTGVRISSLHKPQSGLAYCPCWGANSVSTSQDNQNCYVCCHAQGNSPVASVPSQTNTVQFLASYLG